MTLNARELTDLYNKTHNLMRNIDGLHPQEAFDELLKYLYFKIQSEKNDEEIKSTDLVETAKKINKKFKSFLEKTNTDMINIWTEKKFSVSDKTLVSIHKLFNEIQITKIPLDVKSTALRTFLTPEIRKGLGIFLTPENIVKTIIKLTDPKPHMKILDSCCGSGTFLIEAYKHMKEMEHEGKFEFWGVDKNKRMLLLSELNLGYSNDIKYNSLLADSLFPNQNSWLQENSFDLILTNPPFGVILDSHNYNLEKFIVSKDEKKRIKKNLPSEIAFLEQNLRYLKPGGRLAIVLPKSIITNDSYSIARENINKMGYLTEMIDLPPETFQITGTQTTTVILFITKYKNIDEMTELTNLYISKIENIGYDSTGRLKEGNELPILADTLKIAKEKENSHEKWNAIKGIKKSNTLTELKHKNMQFNLISTESIYLQDVVSVITTGRTPNRDKYKENGSFIIKVGNLTGNGIDWMPRDRNYVDKEEIIKRKNSKNTLLLKQGDILLTSSAHSAKYIAEKIDIIPFIPDFIGEHITFVGEVMLIRANPKMIDPYDLYAYLRHPDVKKQIRNFASGQTAHLKSRDLLNLKVPKYLLQPDNKFKKISNKIQQEVELSYQKNKILYEIVNLYKNINL